MRKKDSFLVVCWLVMNLLPVHAQEIRIFTLQDFELKHAVRHCLVNTSYGKEEHEFNTDGFLTKSVTHYNDKDRDILYFIFKDTILQEKRLETYRDNLFDPATSIAHFYTIDTLETKQITEKVISYEREFLEQYVYSYDDQDRLKAILRTNAEGTDETTLSYISNRGETTVTWALNGEPLKSVRTSEQKKPNGEIQKVILTKQFVKGEGNKAMEEVFDATGKLKAKQDFIFNAEKASFVPMGRTAYKYNEEGFLQEETAKDEGIPVTRSYIYQYDRAEDGNWIKKIITPENSYVTRKITYYPEEKPPLAEEKQEKKE